jgi:hypothetical protein
MMKYPLSGAAVYLEESCRKPPATPKNTSADPLKLIQNSPFREINKVILLLRHHVRGVLAVSGIGIP